MGWMEASILFVLGLVAFTVLISVGVELLPSMAETMGSTTVLMVSAMFVIMLVSILLVYMKQSQQPDQYLGSSGGNF